MGGSSLICTYIHICTTEIYVRKITGLTAAFEQKKNNSKWEEKNYLYETFKIKF